MLTTTFLQTRMIFTEWRRRVRTRRELSRLGAIEQQDLGCRFDVTAEVNKPFWRS